MKNRSIFIIIVACFLTISCGHKHSDEQISEVPEDLISITREQFDTGNMAIGEPLKTRFNEMIKCNGNIIVEPSGTARISTIVPGLVKRIYCSNGEKVNAGQPLFELTGNEFIELQRDLAETASQMKRVRSEYERMKSLYSEKVGSEKELMLAESEYNAASAKYSALRMKIKLLGLDESKIEEGNFYEYFTLKSPINGYLAEINVSVGQYADQQAAIAEIFDVTRLRLRIAVFEKDLDKLEENQKISFTLLGTIGKSYAATLKSIGRNVNDETRSIMCFADLDESGNVNFVNNAYVDAAVFTKSDTVMAVPEESIVRFEGNNYLLEYVRTENDNYLLKKTRVEIGRLDNGYAEILNQPDINKIITKGAYNIRIE
jgi:cobalt-zinc-cadmium efflux system membrane fusion protein